MNTNVALEQCRVLFSLCLEAGYGPADVARPLASCVCTLIISGLCLVTPALTTDTSDLLIVFHAEVPEFGGHLVLFLRPLGGPLVLTTPPVSHPVLVGTSRSPRHPC